MAGAIRDHDRSREWDRELYLRRPGAGLVRVGPDLDLESAIFSPLPDASASLGDISMISRRDSIAPSALYSQLDKQMLGIKTRKRRSKSGVFNVRALDAIVGLAASGFFNASSKKRKRELPTQTALGFINVPSVQLKRKRMR